MTHSVFNFCLVELEKLQRRKVVKALLCANNAHCFSTEEYAEAYYQTCRKNYPVLNESFLKVITGLAPKHLRSAGMIEIRPGIWAENKHEE